jgi:murein DD-endopeptidase MepM/ murein hydrolase activator NlpD
MPSSLLPRCFSMAFALAFTAFVPVAQADEVRSGGASFASRPEVKKLECVTGERSKCPEGELLRVRGESLEQTDAVVFLGSSGRADDERATPDKRSPHRVLVRVPAGAHSGPVRVMSRVAGASRASRRLRVVAAPQPAAGVAPAGEGVFPVRGRYDFGTAVNRFGGGRGHEGQDVFAACATPIVAARSGVVSWTAFHRRAGNYVVITADDGTSQAYMHLLRPTIVQRRARVVAGQPIGQVGQTGRATGCHLHYESWTAPGWYRGGRAIDPLPELQQFAARD